MPAIYMPPKIEIVETIGCPEFFADGVVFVDRRDVITGRYYTDAIGSQAPAVEVLRIHFGRESWMKCLTLTIASTKGGQREH